MSSIQLEEFTAFENKVDEVMQILNLMSSDDKKQSEEGIQIAHRLLGIEGESSALNKVDVDGFPVKINHDRTAINKNEMEVSNPEQKAPPHETQAFMASIEQDANRRAAERKQRESVAKELRKSGNEAFRNGEYEKAISMYSKAIDLVRDSPILYNNRALSYIRLSLFKRAITDCDWVLNKLDEKNLRSLLYRAKANYLLHEKELYKISIQEAKKHHPKELGYIERIVSEIEGTSGENKSDKSCGEE